MKNMNAIVLVIFLSFDLHASQKYIPQSGNLIYYNSIKRPFALIMAKNPYNPSNYPSNQTMVPNHAKKEKEEKDAKETQKISAPSPSQPTQQVDPAKVGKILQILQQSANDANKKSMYSQLANLRYTHADIISFLVHHGSEKNPHNPERPLLTKAMKDRMHSLAV